MTPDAADARWYLYDIVAEDDALLYVGKTNESLRRLVEHLRDQPWAEEICDHRRVRRVYASEPEVLAAERARIVRLRPRFNIQGNQHNPDRVDPRTMRYLDGTPYRPDQYPQPFQWNPDGPAPRRYRSDRVPRADLADRADWADRAYRAPARGAWRDPADEAERAPTRYARRDGRRRQLSRPRLSRPRVAVSRRQRATIGWAMLWTALAGGGWYAQMVWSTPWAARVRPVAAAGVATLVVAYLLSLSRRRRQRLIERAIAAVLVIVVLAGVAWWVLPHLPRTTPAGGR